MGQSRNIERRLGQHVRSGKITPQQAAAATRIPVTGGKTQREMAEQQVIDRHGGIQNLDNLVNRIGPHRYGLMPNQPYIR